MIKRRRKPTYVNIPLQELENFSPTTINPISLENKQETVVRHPDVSLHGITFKGSRINYDDLSKASGYTVDFLKEYNLARGNYGNTIAVPVDDYNREDLNNYARGYNLKSYEIANKKNKEIDEQNKKNLEEYNKKHAKWREEQEFWNAANNPSKLSDEELAQAQANNKVKKTGFVDTSGNGTDLSGDYYLWKQNKNDLASRIFRTSLDRVKGNSEKDYQDWKEKEQKSGESTIDLGKKGAATAMALASGHLLDTAGVASIGKEASKFVGKTLLNNTKYMFYHPIETLVMPEISNKTIDYGNNLSEKITGRKLSDKNLNHLKLATIFMINPAAAAKGRSLISAPVEREGSKFITRYLNKALTNNGRGITQTGNSVIDYARTYSIPGMIGYGTAEGLNKITNGKGIGQHFSDNQNIASGIDYFINPIIYSTTARATGAIARPINNANQLAQGAANPITALGNIRSGIKHNGFIKFLTNSGIITNKSGNTYTGTPQVTQKQIDTGTYRTVASKVNKNPDKSFQHEIASYKDLHVGQLVGNAGKITSSFSIGHTSGAKSAEEALAMRVASANRYGKGSKGFLVKLNGSVDLPKNTISVVRNENGGFSEVPSSKAQLMGGRKDILLGNGHYFNLNGHQTAYHKDPVTGLIYETTFDLWGTGSAGGGIVGKIADSGNHPIVSYQTRLVQGNDLSNPYVRAATKPKYRPTSKWNLLKMMFGKLNTSDLEYSKEELKPIIKNIKSEKQKMQLNLLDAINALK